MQHEQTYLCSDEVETFAQMVTEIRRSLLKLSFPAKRTHPFAVDAWEALDKAPGPVIKQWAEEAPTFFDTETIEPADHDASDYYGE